VIYRPGAFAMDERAALDDFMQAYPFATVITVQGGEPVVSHVPLRLEGNRLLGHLAPANPHAKCLEQAPALAQGSPEDQALAAFMTAAKAP